MYFKKKAVRLISNKDHNLFTIFVLPGNPVTYWHIDTFTKVPCDPLFKKHEILKISDIFKLATLRFVYNSLNKTNPTQFHSYYQFPNYQLNTAASRNKNITTPMVRTVTYGLKSLKYTGCILWNALPNIIRNTSSLISFSKSVKLHLLNKYN